VSQVIKQLLTEADNSTWDVGRFQWVIGTIIFFLLSLYAYGYNGQAFDPMTWGAGFGAVMGGGGAMVWMKSKET
jgi:hypothetical protein